MRSRMGSEAELSKEQVPCVSTLYSGSDLQAELG